LRSLRVDHDLHALVLDQLIGRVYRLGIFHGVFHAGAAAILHAAAPSGDGLFGTRHHFLDAHRGGIGESHHLGSGSSCSHGHSCQTLICCLIGRVATHHIFNTSPASSDILLGSHGGSHTTATLVSFTPGTLDTAFSTMIGKSCAAGQFGDVSDMSIFTSRSSP